MGGISYTAHISKGSSAITSKSKLEGVAKHNLRKYKSSDYSAENITLLCGTRNLIQDVKKVYQREFTDSIKEYNEKQKRADRKIEDYFSYVSERGQDMAVEIIFQCGDKAFWEQHNADIVFMKQVYKILLDKLQEYLPDFKVANAVIHFDEASPHMHVVGVPVGRGFKNGPETKVSKRSVFTKETLSEILQDKLREQANFYMEQVFQQSIQEKSKGRNYDLSVAEYKLQQTKARYHETKVHMEEQQKQCDSLETQIEEKEQELVDKQKKTEELDISIVEMKAKNEELQEETDKIIKYANARVVALSVEEDEISKNVNDLKEQKTRLEDSILVIESSSKEVTDSIWTYENGAEYRLAEPDMFMSAKGYKEKVVEPLRKKFLRAIRGLVGKIQELEIKYRRLRDENELISENVMELRRQLKERDTELATMVVKVNNLDVLREYLVEKKLEKMVKVAKEYVLLNEEQKRLNEVYWGRKR